MIIMREVLVRPGVIDSERVCSLPVPCQLFFRNLLHACDGMGRFPADADELRNAFYWRAPGVSRLHVEAWLTKVHQAGLVKLYTSGGRPYGEIANYGQRDKRRRAVYPPRDDEQLNFAAGPPESPPRPRKADKNRIEEKRREEKGEGEEPASLSQVKPCPESNEAFVERLTRAYPGLDLAAQEKACRKYCQRHGKTFERGYFERWIALATPPIEQPLFAPKKQQQNPTTEPDGWRSVIMDTNYGPAGAFEASAWSDLPSDVQAWVLEELKKTT
jgi:hypothetical protein